MSDKYLLEGTTPVPVEDIRAWSRWFTNADRHVAETWVTSAIRVSTIFLGLDHNYLAYGPPVLFETMVFGGPCDQAQTRYATWGQAEDGHEAVVEQVRQALARDDA